jgi:peptidoglycan-N-acetylglucosamine deacetylase
MTKQNKAKRKQLIVTTSWDDGHILDIRLAKLLKKYAIKGTFYISPYDREFPANKLLSKEQTIAISSDFEIGAHTMTHPVLTKIPLQEATNEISVSKQYLEALCGKKVVSFCYPRGAYNKSLAQAVKKAGFTSARTVERYHFNITKDRFTCGTTFHCYRHYSDIHQIIKWSNWNPFKVIKNLNWENHAKQLFDHSLENGGVFHIWGHSWEIDANNDWERLERVLSYISKRKGVLYLTNGEVIHRVKA